MRTVSLFRRQTAAATFSEVAFQQLGFQYHAVLAGNHFAGQQSGDNLRRVGVCYAETHFADVEELCRALAEKVLVTYEHDLAIAVGMYGFRGNDHSLRFISQYDSSRAKRIGPKFTVRIRQIHSYFHRTRF